MTVQVQMLIENSYGIIDIKWTSRIPMKLSLTINYYECSCTFMLHLLYGQYSWSMTMGFSTLFVTMSSKAKLEAIPTWESCHVLTLTPLLVPVKVQFLTVNPTTSSSFIPFPRLPTLIPCPGPQKTSDTKIFLLLDQERHSHHRWL